MPGGKGFQYTGQLGEVMQESALTAAELHPLAGRERWI